MGRVWFDDYPEVGLDFSSFKIIPEIIQIDTYDDVNTLSLISTSTDAGFSTPVENNSKDLNGLITELGNYEIEMATSSGGFYSKKIDIISHNTLIVFNKIDYDFELRRLDDEGNRIENSDEELLSQTFVSVDQINIQFFELDGHDLENDGNSCDDIIWEVEGVTDDDGTVDEVDNGQQDVYAFTPNPINRPTQRPVTARNESIRYNVNATILGLRRVFELEQDQIDILRQEYIDFATNFQPGRDNAYLDNGNWNVGNYDYIITESNDNHFDAIYNAIVNNWTSRGYTDNIVVSSAYRNPRRNPGAQNSRHLRGLALDIYPEGGVNLQRWLDLRASGNDININGLSITAHCDRSGTFVDNNCSIANHIHVQWQDIG
ncbi:D-Ala-D-Ala carboxypeptidase family metallohydrolase [Costertonia aggregata]|uniref:Peptidase M15A C-terminal domain-containing protein n=1 Tax=Costertonia aggregata TaxID=343403 RepID=A0A7H9AMA5_9FLAO|nr:D-Ala-D-Ala carboxypeptidase family metallohydrolase [Costertonia aggregata]QLG44503.1 hypothetical protein HYG79_03790 [Costertonia aggregata]